MRIPIHGSNDGKIVTPSNTSNVREDPAACYGDKGYFLPCNCIDLCPYIEANGDTMVGLKFEVAVVPVRAKASSFYWENISKCPDVTVAITYEDMLGGQIEPIVGAETVAFADDYCDVDTSHLFHFDKSAETGYIKRGETGLIVIEVTADPNNTLMDSCCGGVGSCAQPMLRWGIKYDGANVMNMVMGDDCLGEYKDLMCLECPTDDQQALFEASDRFTDLALAFSRQGPELDKSGIPRPA